MKERQLILVVLSVALLLLVSAQNETAPQCTDTDADTYAVEGGACGLIDCDDTNPLLFPNATREVDFHGRGTVGICQPRVEQCTGETGTFTIIDAGQGPETEVCDAQDNDCNGEIDGMGQACYTGSPGTEGAGLCRGGTQVCTAGTFGSCSGETLPQEEICDGLDNSCNALIDCADPDYRDNVSPLVSATLKWIAVEVEEEEEEGVTPAQPAGGVGTEVTAGVGDTSTLPLPPTLPSEPVPASSEVPGSEPSPTGGAVTEGEEDDDEEETEEMTEETEEVESEEEDEEETEEGKEDQEEDEREDEEEEGLFEVSFSATDNCEVNCPAPVCTARLVCQGTEQEEKTKVEVDGDVSLSAEAQTTLNQLVASLEPIAGKVELKLKVKKDEEEEEFEAEIKKGTLTAEQSALWGTLQEQAKLLVEATLGEEAELEIEIEHELGTDSLAVENGQLVEIEADDDCEFEQEEDGLEVEGNVVLEVTCTDAKGNAGTATAVPVFPRTEEMEAAVKSEAGTTPDSFLHFLDLALENIALALTFNTDERITKELEFAKERLAEARAMASKGKFEAVTKAVEGHKDIMIKLKEEVGGITDTGVEGELRKKLEVEQKIKQHRDQVKEVEQELKIKIKVEGEVTPDYQDLIDGVLSQLGEQTGEVEIEIEQEKGKTKIKIEQETDRDGDEVEKEIKRELEVREREEREEERRVEREERAEREGREGREEAAKEERGGEEAGRAEEQEERNGDSGSTNEGSSGSSSSENGGSGGNGDDDDEEEEDD